MPVVPLHAHPDLEQLKGTAKVLRNLVRAGDPGALGLVREHHPRLADVEAGSDAATAFKLADAQLTLARHYGFPSWVRLRDQVELVTRLARSPHRRTVSSGHRGDPALVDELIRLACLTYGADSPSRVRQARGLLASRPDLAGASVHAMATVGDHQALRDALTGDPVPARRSGGPFDWEPLLYAAYSRLNSPAREHDTLEAARVLLDAGADPNAGYLWEGLVPPFTALTGAFGRGEGSPEPHQRSIELATLLLDAGADPNDGQTIYNCGLGDTPRDDTDWLELLLQRGLGTRIHGPWYRLLGTSLTSPSGLIAEALQHAAENGLTHRVRLLLDHGADPNARASHPIFDGRTPYAGAIEHGHVAVGALLLAAGADGTAVDPITAFVGACLDNDRPSVDAGRRTDPSLLAGARQRYPDLIRRAAEHHHRDALPLLIELGFDINDRHAGSTALHAAAWTGNLEMVQALLDAGADPAMADTEFNGTPAAWAHHASHHTVAEYLEHQQQRPDP